VRIEGAKVLTPDLQAERILAAVKEAGLHGRRRRSVRYGVLQLTFQEIAAATEAARIASPTLDAAA
jgi:hypothetical protein